MHIIPRHGGELFPIPLQQPDGMVKQMIPVRRQRDRRREGLQPEHRHIQKPHFHDNGSPDLGKDFPGHLFHLRVPVREHLHSSDSFQYKDLPAFLLIRSVFKTVCCIIASGGRNVHIIPTCWMHTRFGQRKISAHVPLPLFPFSVLSFSCGRR